MKLMSRWTNEWFVDGLCGLNEDSEKEEIREWKGEGEIRGESRLIREGGQLADLGVRSGLWFLAGASQFWGLLFPTL